MTWRTRFPEELTCVRCLQKKETRDMDRLLWCEDCKEAARQRAVRWGWIAAAMITLLLGLWIWLFIRPSDLIIGGWLATLAAAFYLTGRMFRELFFGISRIRNRRAVEASPPDPGRQERPEGS